MSDTQKDVCWIALDREVAEAFGGPVDLASWQIIHAREACRKSLVTECFEVGGEVCPVVDYSNGETTEDRIWETNILSDLGGDLPEKFPLGPCRVIVIAGERDA